MSPKLSLPLGPVMLDLKGKCIAESEIEILRHPLVGGVILFGRNFESPEQIKSLCHKIHSLRKPELLIAVDHEGGRVQRFKHGMTSLPAVGLLGKLYQNDSDKALEYSYSIGWLMAKELLSLEVDFSFAPVLDIECGLSDVIGDRAFGNTPDTVSSLAESWVSGVHKAGMAAAGKHFPGHGSVKEDSHVTIPVDNRGFDEINRHDLVPFVRLIKSGIEGIMPAHVYYPKIDADMSAGFSKYWLNKVLRSKLKFKGVIFSDDLNMAGASEIGDFPRRARAALHAGCDMILVCNTPDAAITIIDDLKEFKPNLKSSRHLETMHGDTGGSLRNIARQKEYKMALNNIESLSNMV